jgi:hypothetical protein
MNEDAKRLLDALRGLVEQVESNNARDGLYRKQH